MFSEYTKRFDDWNKLKKVTGRAREDKFHFPLKIKEVNSVTKEVFTKTVFVKLTQARMINNKRLLRKVDVINKDDFNTALEAFRAFIYKSTPHIAVGCLGGRRPNKINILG
jgi:hypothetical protein